MKKKSISLFMVCLLMLGVPGKVQALSLKERAQNIRGRAIALAKKGGAQSKKLWDKIKALGNVFTEYDTAEKELSWCCSGRVDMPIPWPLVLSPCAKRCSDQVKQYRSARRKLLASITVLSLLVTGAMAGAIGGLRAVVDEAERKKREEEARRVIEERPVSPVYEAKP